MNAISYTNWGLIIIAAAAISNLILQFYLIMNLAVGGTNGYFPDSGNAGGKPWTNSQSFPHTAFWRGKEQWLDSWKLGENDGLNASLIIDSVRVWAL